MRRTTAAKALFAFILIGTSVQAQHLDFGFDFGVKGGVPFTNVLESSGLINSQGILLKQSGGYLIGPVAELRIPFGFAFEADGLYRSSSARFLDTSVSTSAWEIPYLAKFRFPIPLLKPFVSGGGAYRSFTDLPSSIAHTHNAFVLGGGLELRVKKLRLSGELRWRL